MYELIQLSEHDYYIDCPAKIGLIRLENDEVILIDSGSDKDAAKKILKILNANNWTLKAVFNTHSHADHIGGNKLLQDRTGCKIYANLLENTYTNHPELEAMGLYGGLPFKELKNKFLLAQKSDCEQITDDVLPQGMSILPLPGHSFDMIGFKTADGNIFLADCVSSAETLGKYGIAYLWDPMASIRTLEYVKSLQAEVRFIPAHAPVTEDITELADINIAAIKKVMESILQICEEGCTFEEILKKLFDAYGMTLTAQQYVLIGSTVRSYLSALYTEGRLKFEFVENRMIWK